MDALIANNHFWRQKWSMDLFNSTILSDIWPEVLFFSSFATMVVLVTKLTTTDLGISNQLLTVFGIVLAFVISFRTSSANERHKDGAALWATIRAGSRTLAQQIWLHVPNERTLSDGTVVPTLEIIIEKKTMINLLYAFSVSIKHLLRNEPGVYYEDLYEHIAFHPRHAAESPHPNEILPLWHIHGGRRMTPRAAKRKDTLQVMVQQETPPLKPARIPPETTIYDYFGILRFGRWLVRKFLLKTHLKEPEPKRPKKRIAYSEVVESTVPLEIWLTLQSYSAFLMSLGCMNNVISTGMTATLSSLHDALSHLERICNNPIPFAYQAHLRMCLWLYLMILPFQLVDDFGYVTIPAVAFVSFLLMGFLEIGQEIENPFNYGMNDLDLDWYCDFIKLNLYEITAIVRSAPSEFIYNDKNHPFAPLDRRNAPDLLDSCDREYHSPENDPDIPKSQGEDGLRSLFVRNWREVDRLTRDTSRRI